MRENRTVTIDPIRVRAGDPNPLTPADMRAAGIPAGAVATADTINAALDRLRAANPDGQLPAHIQAKLDQLAVRVRDAILLDDDGTGYAQHEPGPWRTER